MPSVATLETRNKRSVRPGDWLDGHAGLRYRFFFGRVQMKILFVSSEGLPYSKTGGLADVVESLPRELREAGQEVAVLLPRYRGNKITSTLVSSVTVALGDTLRFPAIVQGPSVGGVRYFFVDDPEFFDRDQLYGDKTGDYPDNAERFAEFCRVAIEFAKRVWLPDVIHCHDWQSALVPVLLRTQHASDPVVRSLPVVLTIHNLAFHGSFPEAVLRRIGLPESLFTINGLEFYGKVNFLKGGLIFADYLTTVSRRYAKEIQTPEYGAGLDGVIRNRADRLIGILNGVDYATWSPEADTFIAQNYSVHNLDGKKACKKELLALLRLPEENMGRPLIGIVSRFADQKGFDLIAEIAGDLMKENVVLVALGTGQPQYEKLFQNLAEKYPARVGVKIGYDNALAHKIEAGADMFLMPSRFEPCGLNQIYSLRYGTVPIVRATGGLDDTIQSFAPKTQRGTGFKFDEYDGKALLGCIRAALKTYRDPKAWHAVQVNGMAKDFSWKASAAAYVTLYEAARRSRIPRPARSSK
ncbi:MAG TPA: glycogen synthase GlgA [Candidatus Polarisedimenticolia bacterium]|nr:glycogen synthase GlgA [Candidatus Polarisedimenticolia bacterium]